MFTALWHCGTVRHFLLCIQIHICNCVWLQSAVQSNPVQSYLLRGLASGTSYQVKVCHFLPYISLQGRVKKRKMCDFLTLPWTLIIKWFQSTPCKGSTANENTFRPLLVVTNSHVHHLESLADTSTTDSSSQVKNANFKTVNLPLSLAITSHCTPVILLKP